MTPDVRGVAAFDFDGTFVRGDSFPRFLAFVLGRRRFAAVLARSAPAMVAGYRRAGRDGAKAALIARALTGLPADQVAAKGEAFAQTLLVRVRPAMAERMRWHADERHERILVSASLELYLQPLGRLCHFDDVIATRLEVGSDGLLTGRIHGANVRAGEKALRLAEAIGTATATVWAYGDSAGDRQMLEMADHPSWVGHRLRLRHRRVNAVARRPLQPDPAQRTL